MTRAELATPALLLDLDRFERNVRKMAAHVKAAGKKLRPHAKTHKCPEIALRQVAAGAVGVCVAKVGEAEVMAAAGVRSLLITTEVVGPEEIRGLQGYAGQCAHVAGFEERQRASRRWMARLMKTRELFEKHGLPVDIVSGGSSGTFNIDSELEGLTELQSGSYCVMDLDYRRIGGPRGAAYDDFEMALTVLTTVVSVPSQEMAMVDAGFKAFSTDRPFVPETVEWPGVEYSWAGDEHGRLMTIEPGRLPVLGQLIEFFPPHCDPTIHLYDRIYAMRADKVEAVWEISGRGRSQ